MLGQRCDEEVPGPKCKEDLNAGTLFTMLSNDLGIHAEPLLIDLDPGQQVPCVCSVQSNVQ